MKDTEYSHGTNPFMLRGSTIPKGEEIKIRLVEVTLAPLDWETDKLKARFKPMETVAWLKPCCRIIGLSLGNVAALVKGLRKIGIKTSVSEILADPGILEGVIATVGRSKKRHKDPKTHEMVYNACIVGVEIMVRVEEHPMMRGAC